MSQVLLDGATHSAPEMAERTGISMSTTYGILRRMTLDGWLTRTAVPGTNRRSYHATATGLRAMRYLIALTDQPEEGSRSSRPTASRSSS